MSGTNPSQVLPPGLASGRFQGQRVRPGPWRPTSGKSPAGHGTSAPLDAPAPGTPCSPGSPKPATLPHRLREPLNATQTPVPLERGGPGRLRREPPVSFDTIPGEDGAGFLKLGASTHTHFPRPWLERKSARVCGRRKAASQVQFPGHLEGWAGGEAVTSTARAARNASLSRGRGLSGAWAGRGRALERRPLCVVSYRRVPAACALTRAFRGCRNLGPQEERTEARREDAFLVFPLSQRSARLALPEPVRQAGGPGDAPVEQGGLANRRPRSPVPGSLTRRLLCSRGPWVRVAGLGVRRRPRKGLHNKYF